jgi:hypothetical protein
MTMSMSRPVVDHFPPSGNAAAWVGNKTGVTRLGFAVQLKFLTWRDRFPRLRQELPPDAVEHRLMAPRYE